MEQVQNTCPICLIKMPPAAPKRFKTIQIECGHLFHGECIRKWLVEAEMCPMCRHPIEIGEKDFPLIVENTNCPDSVLLELHCQLVLLHLLHQENNRNKQIKEYLKTNKLCYQRELEEWQVIVSKKWQGNERFIKIVLVGNFISMQEMDKYINYFKSRHLEFFERCDLVRDQRIVNKF